MDLDMLRALLALHAATAGNGTGARATRTYATPLLRTVREWNQPRHQEDALITALRTDLTLGSSPIDGTDAKGRTALFHLVKKRLNRAARFLVERGADPLLEDAKGMSPLSIACMGATGQAGLATVGFINAALSHMRTAGRIDDVERVLNRHVASDPTSRSLLHIAVSKVKPTEGGLALLHAALSNGADPNAPMHLGARALHGAVAQDNAAAVLALLRHGADIDAVKDDGATPLHFAVLRDKPGMVALLLARGADPSRRFGRPTADDVPYWEGKTAAELAFMNADKLMADAIYQWKDLWEPLPAADDTHAIDCTD
ncbi:Ankyrin repeat domain containing protein [Pandoravirus macleodensis]|uniref:Ankyrin repeat domain containing protein n=1 Tax=Pandoravirus macleodensis TaxID=2107707 RepID=A0A2U7UEQ2_9VIRU|nr:Ankyrin repeat domain containing protein [Pandoravirus macleodensis]AVK76949.1 Ankyrin repeat domain containing protein [Pandoravirus macleodensis]UMO79590.1 Ankyrin repeat domain containing protein [Pandoravirus aubagnensis]